MDTQTLHSRSLHRRTKIVATVGPASGTPEKIRELIRAGVNVFRLNFSHGSHEVHTHSLTIIREASKELGIPVAVLQDLSGPKIRITPIEGDYATLEDKAEVSLKLSKGEKSSAAMIYVEGIDPGAALEPGQPVLLADGIIVLRCNSVSNGVAKCTAVKGGRLRSKVGIAFPDSNVSLPATTEKDLVDLKWGIEHKIDYVALSFVQNAADILYLRSKMKEGGKVIPIVAKIERKSAIENIKEILEVTDGLMVARGDLGLEYPLERLSRLQKMLIEASNAAGVPVIVATQMLHSMVTAIRPTRAEVSDVATAVMSGADAVMLSEETTIGENPVNCVEFLNNIAVDAEQSFAFDEFKVRLSGSDQHTVPDAVAYAACAAAVKIGAKALVACTNTGTSARLLAKYRPQQPLYGTSSSEETLRKMCLFWGITPISTASAITHTDEIDVALKAVQAREKLANGSKAVIIGGLQVNTPGATSVMEVKNLDYL